MEKDNLKPGDKKMKMKNKCIPAKKITLGFREGEIYGKNRKKITGYGYNSSRCT